MRIQWSVLLTAFVVCLLFTAGSVSAQTVYPVCNYSSTTANVALWYTCGGGSQLVTITIPIAPGHCVNTWPVPSGCLIKVIEINAMKFDIPYNGPMPPPFTHLNASAGGATIN